MAQKNLIRYLVVFFFSITAILMHIFMISAYFKLDVDTSEKFTELYFTKPQELPKRIFPEEEIPINFTIVNKEGKDVEYSYQLAYEDS